MNALTDFNDLSAFEGLDAVTDIVNHATPSIEPPVWPEPMLPGSLHTPDMPADILTGAWGDMAKAVSASTQTPLAMSVMCVLGVLATCLQRRFEVAPHGDDYTEPLALWCVSASPSGTRKTAVMGAFLKPIVAWEKIQSDRFKVLIARNNAARSTGKKRIEALNQQAAKCKDPAELKALKTDIENEELDMPDEVRAPRLFTGDTTAERLQNLLVENSERMAVHSDESGIFTMISGGFSGGAANLDVFLKGHAGSAIRVDRAGRIAHVDKPALSMNLMVQPGMMADVAGSKGFRDSGLLARFLYAVPKTNVGKRNVRDRTSVSLDVRDRYERAVASLLDGYLCEAGTPVPKVQVLDLVEPAYEAWLDFSQWIEDNQGDGEQFEGIRDWTSKLAGAVARIAALLELAEFGLHAESVSSSAMERAIRLAHVLIPHAQAAFGLLGTDETDTDALAVLKWVSKKGLLSFPRSTVQQAMRGRFGSIAKLKKAMERLADMDCVREYMQYNKKGSPPSTCYQINPALIQ